MSYLDEISAKIYEQPEYCVKGYSKELEDVFLAKHGDSTYILFVMKTADFFGNEEAYSYVLFSSKESRTVSSDEDTYKTIVGRMPALDRYKKIGGDLDPLAVMELQETLDDLAASYAAHGFLSAEEEKQYKSYLREMYEMQSPDFKRVYAAAASLL